MTKIEAVKLFKTTVLPGVQKTHGKDKVAVRTAWNDFTDGLCKGGEITSKQYDRWISPFDS